MLQAEPREPIMYLDADGVLFPYRLVEVPSMYGGKSELYNKSTEFCDPAISKALASLAIETVMASSRQDTFLEQFAYLSQTLGAVRSLEIDPVEPADIRLKRDAVLRDYALQQRSFVWVDDHISALSDDERADIETHYNSLLIVPQGMTGITISQIEEIREFISR